MLASDRSDVSADTGILDDRQGRRSDWVGSGQQRTKAHDKENRTAAENVHGKVGQRCSQQTGLSVVGRHAGGCRVEAAVGGEGGKQNEKEKGVWEGV